MTSTPSLIFPNRILPVLLIIGAMIAGCSSPPKHPQARGGGYYMDDGPGDNIPANIARIPDAVPRIEPHNPANFRPYNVLGQRFVPVSANAQLRQRGVASWYGRKFHGQKTANGESSDMYALTAAHPTLPLPSYARVTHERSGRSVIVRVNDRGPFLRGRVIDLSYAAAAKLGIIGKGSDTVVVEHITHADIRQGLNMAANSQPAPIQTANATAPGAEASPAGSVRQASAPPRVTAAAGASSAAGAASSATVASGTTAANSAPTPDALAVLDPQAIVAMHDAADTAPMNLTAAAGPADTSTATAGSAGESSAPSQPPVASVSSTVAEAAPAPRAPNARPGPTLTADSSGGIYLQFGAFGSYISADRLANQLSADIEVIEGRRAQVYSGSDLHRVRVGPYPDRTSAVNAAVRIQEITGMQPTLAQR